jgi:hypothetical protein
VRKDEASAQACMQDSVRAISTCAISVEHISVEAAAVSATEFFPRTPSNHTPPKKALHKLSQLKVKASKQQPRKPEVRRKLWENMPDVAAEVEEFLTQAQTEVGLET